jgi:hypothetical protein
MLTSFALGAARLSSDLILGLPDLVRRHVGGPSAEPYRCGPLIASWHRQLYEAHSPIRVTVILGVEPDASAIRGHF